MKKRMTSLLLALVLLLAMPLAAFAEEDAFGAGTSDEHSYWNDAISLGCTLDDSWYFYTDEEIVASSGATADMLKDDLAEAVREAGSLMDMMAVNMETGENVNVTLERLSLANSLLMDAESYAQATVSQLTVALEQMGLTDVTIEIDTMEFAGEEQICLKVSGNMAVEGLDIPLPLYETMVIIKSGRTIMAITACTYWEDATEDILVNFYREQP